MKRRNLFLALCIVGALVLAGVVVPPLVHEKRLEEEHQKELADAELAEKNIFASLSSDGRQIQVVYQKFSTTFNVDHSAVSPDKKKILYSYAPYGGGQNTAIVEVGKTASAAIVMQFGVTQIDRGAEIVKIAWSPDSLFVAMYFLPKYYPGYREPLPKYNVAVADAQKKSVRWVSEFVRQAINPELSKQGNKLFSAPVHRAMVGRKVAVSDPLWEGHQLLVSCEYAGLEGTGPRWSAVYDADSQKIGWVEYTNKQEATFHLTQQ